MRHDGHTIESGAGAIRIEGSALVALVVAAAELVDGSRVRRPKRGVEVQIENGHARVQLELAARYGTVLRELGEAVQRSVADALGRASGLPVTAVDVAIAELEQV